MQKCRRAVKSVIAFLAWELAWSLSALLRRPSGKSLEKSRLKPKAARVTGNGKPEKIGKLEKLAARKAAISTIANRFVDVRD